MYTKITVLSWIASVLQTQGMINICKYVTFPTCLVVTSFVSSLK